MSQYANDPILERIHQQVQSNPIIIYMKGSPDAPQCGFSARASQVLMECGERFAFVDVFTDEEILDNLDRYANWPTFPQIYIKGELIGGCDIVTEMFEKGELQPLVKAAVAP